MLKNASLRIFQYGIAGTPLGVPYEGVWNGSIWTLWWEFLCYLGVLLLGVTRLINRAWVLPVAFGLCVLGVLSTSYGPIDNFYVFASARFGIMFIAGGLVYRFRHRIRASWVLVGLSMLVVVASAWLPDYRVVAALPLAYVVITTGALLRQRIFWLRNDISYGIYVYAFPLQQTLVLLGAAVWGVPAFISPAVRRADAPVRHRELGVRRTSGPVTEEADTTERELTEHPPPPDVIGSRRPGRARVRS